MNAAASEPDPFLCVLPVDAVNRADAASQFASTRRSLLVGDVAYIVDKLADSEQSVTEMRDAGSHLDHQDIDADDDGPLLSSRPDFHGNGVPDHG